MSPFFTHLLNITPQSIFDHRVVLPISCWGTEEVSVIYSSYLKLGKYVHIDEANVDSGINLSVKTNERRSHLDKSSEILHIYDERNECLIHKISLLLLLF